MSEKLKVFEGFCGVGSQRMALKNIGVDFEIVGTSEVDKYAILSYDAIHENEEHIDIPSENIMIDYFKSINIGYNFSTGKSEIPSAYDDIIKLYKASKRMNNYGDIRLIKEDELPDMDLFTYSFPCKNFSLVGKQAGAEKGSGTQSSLVWECEKIIKLKKPKYLMMENVKNMVGKKHIHILNEWNKILDCLGYNNFWKVVNSKDFGIPQNRERVIMISIRKDLYNDFSFPEGVDLNIRLKDILEDSVDNKYYLTNEKIDKISNWKAFQRPFERVLGNNSICPTITARGAGEYHSGMIIYSDKLKNTINCEKEGYDLHSLNIRLLSPIESWRLMGYKDEDFYKAKDIAKLSERKLYERAGRGIVVPMLEHIFKKLFKEYI